jgi:hypothetical protein
MLLISKLKKRLMLLKQDLIKNFGYCEFVQLMHLNFVASIFAKGDSIKSLGGRVGSSNKKRPFRFRKIVKGK